MKFTELNIRKNDTNSFTLSVDVFRTSGIYIQTVSKAFEICTKEDMSAWLSLHGSLDPGVFYAANSDSFHRRCRAARRGSLVLSLRWDGDFNTSGPARRSAMAALRLKDPRTIDWELLPFKFLRPEDTRGAIPADDPLKKKLHDIGVSIEGDVAEMGFTGEATDESLQAYREGFNFALESVLEWVHNKRKYEGDQE